ncbi:MAG: patatin-like phospholipase family protein [Candidatus Omnitrophica bacterium]|nr:patatin-like phospholipase family protein [Candidatus Omnitrophota bacterium]
MIGLALSGGGSRAMAFHLGCLRALNDIGILDRIGVISTISGGSIIGAYYAYTPQKSFDEFESDICKFLREGFQRRILLELAKPHNFVPCISSSLITYACEIAAFLNKGQFKPQRYPSRTDIFHKVLHRDVFHEITMNSPRRNNVEVVIGACELRTGSAFRFGNNRSGSWRYGDVAISNIDVAFAVTASAAYPILLPALDRTLKFCKNNQEKEQRVLLTDGGIYDNLGVKVLEPGRDSAISLHTFPCNYIISCDADQGQESGKGIPNGAITRVKRSFEIIHKRVQDSTMHRLHMLKAMGSIKGFALPYLGQQDNRLPWEPGVLVPRGEVIDYPTNFSAMSNKWIDKLSGRGEQLTRLLVSYYLQDLITV